MLVEPTVLFVAQPASTSLSIEHPDLIPIGELSEMAPSINAYELMGKKSKGASGSKNKGKAKEDTQAKKSKRPVFEVIAPEQTAPNADLGFAVLDIQPTLPQIVEIDEPEVEADPAPRAKRARTVGEPSQRLGSSSLNDIWDPEMMVGQDPISIHHTMLDSSNVELSAKVAHALSGVACLPGDIRAWETMFSGQIFRHISRGLMMVSSLSSLNFINNLSFF